MRNLVACCCALLFIVPLLLPCSPAHAADLHAVTGFDEYAEEHPRVGTDLARRPSLALDKEYLRRHRSLADYLHSHPMARTELEEEEDTVAAPRKPTPDAEHATRTAHRPVTHSIFREPPDDDD